MNGTERKNEDQYLSSTILKAIDVLKLLAEKSMTATEISNALKMNKTTVYRLLYTLEHTGFIEQLPDSYQYRIGIKLVGICSSRVNDIEIITEAKPHLVRLVQQINQPVHLGIYHAGKAVFVDKIDVVNTIRIYSAIGKTIPVHCSAIGKALLMDSPDEENLQILLRYGMPTFTDETITDPEAFLRQMREARARGYTEDNGEHEKNVCCIAAPIYDYRNVITAAISTAAPRENSANNSQFAPLLMEAASKISAGLGAK